MPNAHATLPIALAIVGHTNTGKTSLVRTLLRNTQFGDVANTSGTTRHVEAANILCAGQPIIELRDTPGLEDSVTLYDALQTAFNAQEASPSDSRHVLSEFVNHAIHPELDQELKVLRQILVCDALLYVIDTTEAVLEKYIFELQCLRMAARPIIPVLNFIQEDTTNKQLWYTALANLGLHTTVEFDTVAFSFEAEKRLYQKLQTVMEPHYQNINALLEERENLWQQSKLSCLQCSANMIVAAACTRVPTHKNQPRSIASVELQKTITALEEQCLNTLFRIMQFSETDLEYTQLPISNGQWQLDLFTPEALKAFGINTASAAATGAAVGAGLDLMLAGLSLGAATLMGATLGAGWSTSKRYGSDVLAKFKGEFYIGIDEPTLNVLLARQRLLLQTLFQRGHAAQNKILVEKSTNNNSLEDAKPLIKQLKQLQNTALKNPTALQQEASNGIQLWLKKAIE